MFTDLKNNSVQLFISRSGNIGRNTRRLSVLATASGAITRLKKMPVRLLKGKSEISANGANLNERKWGNLRGNFIQ